MFLNRSKHRATTLKASIIAFIVAALGLSLLVLVPAQLATAPDSDAAAGPGNASIPGFIGYVTAGGHQLGIGRMANGQYGVCVQTGGNFPWPNNVPKVRYVNRPEVGYLLSRFVPMILNGQVGAPNKFAAALWWAIGKNYGMNVNPGNMQENIDLMHSENPGFWQDVRNLKDALIAEAHNYASGPNGYTQMLNLTGNQLQNVGLMSATGNWLPGYGADMLMSGGRFNANGSNAMSIITGPQGVFDYTLDQPTNTAYVTFHDVPNHMVKIYDDHDSTQKVVANAGRIDVTASAFYGAGLRTYNIQKTDTLPADDPVGIENNSFVYWQDLNGDSIYDPASEPAQSATTNAAGNTSPYTAPPGVRVCAQETATGSSLYMTNPQVFCTDGSADHVFDIGNIPVKDYQFVPITVTKKAEGDDPNGMVGVTVEVWINSPDAASGGQPMPNTEYTFTQADLDPVTNTVKHTWEDDAAAQTFSTGAEYFIVIKKEPKGWASLVGASVPVVLNGGDEDPTSFYTADLEDVIEHTPTLETQTNVQTAFLNDTISDNVTVNNTGGNAGNGEARSGNAGNGEYRIYGPVAPVLGKCDTVNWTGAPLADEGTFDIPGDGTITGVGTFQVKELGCYTFSERYVDKTDGTPGDNPRVVTTEWTTPGIVTETVNVVNPNLITQINNQNSKTGEYITDTVKIVDPTGEVINTNRNGDFKLYGPVVPGASGTCADAVWKDAPVALEGVFAAVNGVATNVGKFKVETPGCYTFSERMLSEDKQTTYTDWTTPGIAEETTLTTQPYISTQIQKKTVKGKTVLQDTVVINNGGTAERLGHWRLYYAKPVHGKCTNVNWAKGKIIGSGTFTVDGVNNTMIVGKKTVTKSGCYTYSEALTSMDGSHLYTDWTTPGLVKETTLVKPRPVTALPHTGR